MLPCPCSEYLSNAFRALTNESWCDTTRQREIRHVSPLRMPFWSIPMHRVFFACQKGKHCHAPIASTYPILSGPRPTSSWCDTTWQREIRHVSPLHFPFWSIPMNRVFFACQKGKHCHAPIASTYPILSGPRPTSLGVIQPDNVRSVTSPLLHMPF